MMESITQSSNNSTQTSAMEQYWQEQIKLQHESGLSRASYCRQHNLIESRLCYWDKKLSFQNKPAAQFVAVKLSPSSLSASQIANNILCSLEFKNGHRLNIHDQAVLPILFTLLSK